MTAKFFSRLELFDHVKSEGDGETKTKVKGILKFSYSTAYRMMSEDPPAFPRPVLLSKNRVAWRAADIESWIAAREVGAGITPISKRK